MSSPEETFEEFYESRKGYLHLFDRKEAVREAYLKGYHQAINNMFGVLENEAVDFQAD